MANINDATTNIPLKVDTVSNAGRITIYDVDGNAIGSFITDPSDTDRAIPVRNIPTNSQQIIAGLGSGGFYPSFESQFNSTDIAQKNYVSLDSVGSLQTRGTILTDEGSWRDDFSGTALVVSVTGTVSLTNGSTNVTGVGTAFLTELSRNFYIRQTSHSNNTLTKIARVISDTELELDEGYSGSTSNSSIVKSTWTITDSISTGTLAVSNSIITLNASTTINDKIKLSKSGDYCPLRGSFKLSISQRIINQNIFIGFSNFDNSNLQEVKLIFSGTSNTTLILQTTSSTNASDIEQTTVTLPYGFSTTQSLRYDITVTEEKCVLFIEGVQVASNNVHIPTAYIPLDLYAEILNGGTAPVSSTSLSLDFISLTNVDRIEIANNFNGNPIPTRISEDIHTISASLTTTATTADQTILSYTVPTGKTLLIKGYDVSGNLTAVNATNVKIGKDTITTENTSPGTSDSNFFRCFYMAGGTNKFHDFGASAVIFARAGSVIKISVTPSAATSTVWRASLDYILR
jgi:hypothetical protein